MNQGSSWLFAKKSFMGFFSSSYEDIKNRLYKVFIKIMRIHTTPWECCLAHGSIINITIIM